MIILLGFLFLLGLSVGSFIGCWVYRLNRDLSAFRGRSFCPRCRRQLAWFDNVPLFSFLWLRGRCRYCQKPIGVHYPLVELAGGFLPLVVNYHQPIWNGWFFWLVNLVIGYFFLAILVSDWLYQTVPDHFVYPALILCLVRLFFAFPENLLPNLVVAGTSAGFFWLLYAVSRGRGMGLGDVKLAALIGLLLGWPNTLVAFWLAFLTGAFFGVILILLGRKKFGQQIAFGPFLVVCAWLFWFFEGQIWEKIDVVLLWWR